MIASETDKLEYVTDAFSILGLEIITPETDILDVLELEMIASKVDKSGDVMDAFSILEFSL